MSVGAISPSSAYPAPAREAPARAQNATELTPAALALIDKLKSRDTEVRQHEQAHLAAAGGLAVSGASYTYQRGPNGIDYAVGGEVHIDTAPGRTPEETIARAHTIQAAALAPAEPSGADRSVAAQAQQLEQQARAELAVQQAEAALAPAQQAGAPPAPSGRDAGTPSQAGSQQAEQAARAAQASQQSLNRAYDITPLVPPTLNVVA